LDRFNLQNQINNGYVEKKALKHGDALPDSKSDWVAELTLEVNNINQIIVEDFSGTLNLLQIDTEGYDHILVNALDLENHSLDMICFEKLHIPESELGPCITRLKRHGYSIVSSDMDILAHR
jgi:hypothetical protein